MLNDVLRSLFLVLFTVFCTTFYYFSPGELSTLVVITAIISISGTHVATMADSDPLNEFFGGVCFLSLIAALVAVAKWSLVL